MSLHSAKNAFFNKKKKFVHEAEIKKFQKEENDKVYKIVSSEIKTIIVKLLYGHYDLTIEQWNEVADVVDAVGFLKIFVMIRYSQYLIKNKLPINSMYQSIIDKYHDVLLSTKTININYVLLKKIMTLFNTLLEKSSKLSTMEARYPLVHPSMGRPYLDWKVCYCSGCGSDHSSPHLLEKHVKKTHTYTKSFHKSHETAYIDVTEEYIIENNITTCSSILCDKKSFATPKQLIDHLKDLGIKPFWKSRATKISLSDYPKKITKPKTIPAMVHEIYSNASECIICCDDDATITFSPCGHRLVCISCCQDSKLNNCPICRKKIDFLIPFS